MPISLKSRCILTIQSQVILTLKTDELNICILRIKISTRQETKVTDLHFVFQSHPGLASCGFGIRRLEKTKGQRRHIREIKRERISPNAIHMRPFSAKARNIYRSFYSSRFLGCQKY